MKFSKFLLLFCFTVASAPSLLIGQSSLIADGAELKLVSDQFSFTEGPTTDKKGNIYFTDQPNDKIWIYTTDGKLKVFSEKTGRSNGMYFTKKGKLIACADEKNQILEFNKKGNFKVLADGFNGKLFNGPNDVWVDDKGGMYFTDPYYKRDYWTRGPEEQEKKRLYYLDKKGKVSIASESFVAPNGLIGTKDYKKLYVADIGDRKTYVFDIQKDGTLTNQQLFVSMGSDGMTLDELGNVYLCGNGVTIYSPAGEKLGNIKVPQGWTANVTFGGKEGKTLFITALKGVYTMAMKVRGVKYE
ncbi:MAG: SMP-30/gluconolactonase/LRE family protein [Saprospiraceae bacterium]|nr:SMP-30/gluconolactonase/LRE family protein [Saprospiraceae bacterium]